jgi:light-regulated signal transduction histidine kinase (bacteriophytochrome)
MRSTTMRSRASPSPSSDPRGSPTGPAHAERGGGPARRLLPFAILGTIALAILRFAAVESGLFGDEVGFWLFAVLIIGTLAFVVLHLARLADRVEADRARDERENEAAAPALAQRARELERANTELAEAKSLLERSNEELQQFATVASHDLREPLRVVSGFAQMLERRYRDQLGEEGARFIDAITGGVARMDEMITDLLAYARAGRADQPFEVVDCAELVADVRSGLQVAVEESGAQIDVQPLPTVVGNPAALRQVFQNLVENAIKFSDSHPPEIRIWAAEVPGGWRFSVRDNGIGIDPKQSEKIFGMFIRGHSRERYPGTGVGLALCRRIVEAHGGHIWVEPAPGRGSQFMFTVGNGGRPAGTAGPTLQSS